MKGRAAGQMRRPHETRIIELSFKEIFILFEAPPQGGANEET